MITLSIVIPAYNEQNKIEADILSADSFLKSEQITGEIIVVDDGSTDHTISTAEKAATHVEKACVIERLDKNYGKGRAVKTGILKSQGQFVLFADSGVCVPFEQAKSGMEMIQSGDCNIAHGSRKMSGCDISRPQSLYRKMCSNFFHWFLIHDIHRLHNLSDTQCGFKLYQGDVARGLYSQCQMDRYLFDIEIILLALSHGYTIKEFPVQWTCDPDSRLKPAHEAVNVLLDLMRLKKRFNEYLKNN